MKKISLLTVATFIASIFGLGTAFASDASKDAKALGEASLGIQAAIAIAENHVGGKAYEAELETEGGKIFYEVEVVRNGEEFELVIDPTTGKVLSSEKEEDDHESEHEHMEKD
ncbi:MAG: PepSY domain-containing protein [Nitrospinales bacterium]